MEARTRSANKNPGITSRPRGEGDQSPSNARQEGGEGGRSGKKQVIPGNRLSPFYWGGQGDKIKGEGDSTMFYVWEVFNGGWRGGEDGEKKQVNGSLRFASGQRYINNKT